jgi:hypothetical protein
MVKTNTGAVFVVSKTLCVCERAWHCWRQAPCSPFRRTEPPKPRLRFADQSIATKGLTSLCLHGRC